ncbi:MAG: zinc ribbon domain-containing protein, partial [Gemmatales bacterium]|nr:zinc ribbon domain-containing protein [Gemmatales bacterium]MDW8386950.1 zinc ribbon domain-containing protein [Gemmatales bacterium]
MPTYEYRCEACGHHFDEYQSITEEPLRKCPKCRKNRLRRLFGTGGALLFKGSGFYQTDYRSEAYKAAAKAEAEAAKKTGDDGSGTGKTADGSASSAKS